ncbi:NAD-dependent epimerase/dehydratase family protein [Roseospira visakhapatnamensis]|uniref:GDP-L-fucose synthase n=1 Tax=Roseospira visakhapatnamensis TaxID=390880 RepID=A0A7W6W9J1_9PROT|nr:GDP-L-fucose synthase [Roseospira visakhapatnamensis]
MIEDDILNSFAGSNCVVTGGTGMIGRAVARRLCDAGAHVRIISLDDIVVDDRADHVKADLADFVRIKDLTQDMDHVLHVAGIKGSVDVTKSKPASFLVPLLQMNTNVLEAARQNKARKVVYTSTIGAYAAAEVFREDDYDEGQPPMDQYPGWAKRIAEMQVQTYRVQYGLENFAIVRPCNIYGPGDSFKPESAMVIPTLMARIARGDDPVTVWGDGSAIRDFAYCRDVADGTIQALYHGTRGSFVNLASGEEVSIRTLVETLASFIDFRYEFDTSKPSGYPRRVMDISRARAWIGYTPSTSLRQGLEETWTWFRENQSEHEHRKNYFAEG